MYDLCMFKTIMVEKMRKREPTTSFAYIRKWLQLWLQGCWDSHMHAVMQMYIPAHTFRRHKSIEGDSLDHYVFLFHIENMTIKHTLGVGLAQNLFSHLLKLLSLLLCKWSWLLHCPLNVMLQGTHCCHHKPLQKLQHKTVAQSNKPFQPLQDHSPFKHLGVTGLYMRNNMQLFPFQTRYSFSLIPKPSHCLQFL